MLNESPKAVVLVSSIPPSTDPANPQFEIETMAYNSAMEEVIAQRADAGEHIIFVCSGVDPSQISSDHIHPVVHWLSYAQDIGRRPQEWTTEPAQ